MKYGLTLRWYSLLFVLACVIIFICAKFETNVAPEVGASMVALAVFFGAQKISLTSTIIPSSEAELDLLKRKRLVLDAKFAIAGTLINGFSSLIYHLLKQFIG